MKSINKNTLAFNKSSVVELGDHQLDDVNGGSSPFCIGVIVGITITLATK